MSVQVEARSEKALDRRMKLGISVGLLAALAGVAAGQPGTANELLLEASSRAAQSDHAGAAELYRQAYAIDGDVALLPIIAVEYRRAGKPLDAVQYFCTYLYMSPGGPAAADATAQVVALQHDACTPVGWAPAPVRAQAVTKRELAGIGTVTAGALALAAGVYYKAQSSRIGDQIASHDPAQSWPANIHQLEQQGMRDEDLARALWIAGGVAVGSGIALYVSGRAARVAEHVTLAPTPSGGSMVLSGRF